MRDEHEELKRLLGMPLDRRRFLLATGGFAGLALLTQVPGGTTIAAPRFSAYPFTLGVASGDPLPDGVVLWTRLAPDPLNGGGMPPVNVPVRWEVASDAAFRSVVKSGVTLATPGMGHSVHVDVRGLLPAREYYYRFEAGREVSRVGRTKTAPARGAVIPLTFAFASCQDYQAGYYQAWRAMANEDLDFVLHLGDYIYEYAAEDTAVPGRQHKGPEVSGLRSYRDRHAQYKLDADLQLAHARFAFIVTTDDHEVENNYADDINENTETRTAAFLQRRANAYKAYYEHMPLRRTSLPQGPDMLLYRRLAYGNLAEINVLDTRQYRTNQPCGDGFRARCAESLSEKQTMTGQAQEQWLKAGLSAATARGTVWNIVAQQTILAEYDFLAGPPTMFNMDQWDGYVAARRRLLGYLDGAKIRNPVVLTGDIHSSWVFDLKTDFQNPNSKTVGAEFVGTSISSDFLPGAESLILSAACDNPHLKFFEGESRGYVRCTLDRNRYKTDYRVLPPGATKTRDAPATVVTQASFVVENGKPGVQANSLCAVRG